MNYDYRKLVGRIVEYCGTKKNFSEKTSISYSNFIRKLNNDNVFKNTEIEEICKLLEIDRKDIPIYFFCPSCSEKFNDQS
jgi:hypothetical protein